MLKYATLRVRHLRSLHLVSSACPTVVAPNCFTLRCKQGEIRQGKERRNRVDFYLVKGNLGISVRFIWRSDYQSENVHVKLQAVRGKA